MSKTVMIVDDSFCVRQVSTVALKEAGYQVVQALDGQDALEKLDGRKIHLIVADVNMPNMDGITFVKEAKKLSNYRMTPVIMLSSGVSEIHGQEHPMALAEIWITKPFQPAQILLAISELVLP